MKGWMNEDEAASFHLNHCPSNREMGAKYGAMWKRILVGDQSEEGSTRREEMEGFWR
jgi:hypothetical protein